MWIVFEGLKCWVKARKPPYLKTMFLKRKIFERNWKKRFKIYVQFNRIQLYIPHLLTLRLLSATECNWVQLRRTSRKRKMQVMITTMQSKLKMNLCIAPTETRFRKLSRLCKNSPCFQKIVYNITFHNRPKFCKEK